MNIILGSGIVGLFAKKLFGWELLPFKKSRFYSFKQPLAENYIIKHPDLEIISKVLDIPKFHLSPIRFQRGWSISGQVLFNTTKLVTTPYINKLYGNINGSRIEAALKNLDLWIYKITAKEIYDILLNSYSEEIIKNKDIYKNVISIDLYNKTIKTEKKTIEFDKIISTIPLDALCDLCNINHNLTSKDCHHHLIRSQDLNFEGANELLVSDEFIDFFRVTEINSNLFQFMTIFSPPDPTKYYSAFFKKFDILMQTTVKNAIPISKDIPKFKTLEDASIFCVGSLAQWDDLMDVSSCFRRLIRFSKLN